MMQFDYIGNVPVMPVRLVAELIGIDEFELAQDIDKHTECGVWFETGYPAIEMDDLYDYLHSRLYNEAFFKVFG